MGLCLQGLLDADMPSSNAVWGNYLKRHGFKRYLIEDDTVEEFVGNNKGKCVLALSGHVVAVLGNTYYDSWDCGKEHVLYVWRLNK